MKGARGSALAERRGIVGFVAWNRSNEAFRRNLILLGLAIHCKNGLFAHPREKLHCWVIEN